MSDDAAPEQHESDEAVDDLTVVLGRLAGLRRAASWDGEARALPDLHRAAAAVKARQPTDPGPPPVTQDRLDALVAWAGARGARFTPGLRVVASVSGARVEAGAPIPAGAPLVSVPLDLMVRGRDVLETHPTLGPWLAGDPPFGPGTLMLWLLVERFALAPPGPWAPYVAALPGVAPNTALSWPRSPGEHLAASDQGRRFLAGVLQLYCLLHRRLRDTPAEARPFPLAAFTLERWLWAGAMMSSRQTAVGDELALVPLWDLLDHDASLAVGTTALSDDALICHAAVDYAPGERVGMFYGERTPTSHWVHGGFVPPGPPDGDPAWVSFPLPAAAPQRRAKLLFLLANRDLAPEVPVARGDLTAALRRARWYALDVDDLDHLGVSSVVDAWDLDLPLTPAGEARARALLEGWLTGLAGPALADLSEPLFSPEHAFVHAAAHAFYAGLVPLPGAPAQAALLDDPDAPAVDALLARHRAAGLWLRDALHVAGLTHTGLRQSGTWVGWVAEGGLVGVACHGHDGALRLLAHGCAAELAQHVPARSRRPVSLVMGPSEQVIAAHAALGGEAPGADPIIEDLYALALGELRPPAPTGGDTLVARRATGSDVDALVAWRPERRPVIAARVGDGSLWILERGGAPVAMAVCRPHRPDAVVVTDVWTPPEHRAQGFARRVVAAALEGARAAGHRYAVLRVVADNAAAIAAYRALGFARSGDHATLYRR